MHGSLFRVRCMRSWCRYERDDVMDPITPALKVDEGDVERTVGTDELPRCPEC